MGGKYRWKGVGICLGMLDFPKWMADFAKKRPIWVSVLLVAIALMLWTIRRVDVDATDYALQNWGKANDTVPSSKLT